MIISSHLLAMIEDVCTHLLVMQDGRNQYFGAADDLRRQFPNTRTLEEAYFAATGDEPAEDEPLRTGPAIISISDYHREAVT